MNAEAWVLTHALLKTADPVPLALCATAAQVICYSVVYFHGPRLLDWWPRLGEKLARFDGRKYARWSYSALFIGATLGFPPTLLFTLLRRQLGFHFAIYLVLVAVARSIRFVTLAMLPAAFARYFGV